MTEQLLHGCRVLVVEDEYLLAEDLSHALREAGAEVLGPAGSIEDAAGLMGSEARIDAAVLDVNIRGEMVFPVADALRARSIPFAFATGYDKWALPERFSDAPQLEKPFKGQRLATMLKTLLAG